MEWSKYAPRSLAPLALLLPLALGVLTGPHRAVATTPGEAPATPPGMTVHDGGVSLDPEPFLRAFYRDVETSLHRAGHEEIELRVNGFLHVASEDLGTWRIRDLISHPVGWHLVISPGRRTTRVDGVVVERRATFRLEWRYREPWWPAGEEPRFERLRNGSVAEFAAAAVARGELDWAIDRLTSCRVTLSDGSWTRVYRSALTILEDDAGRPFSFQVRDPVIDNVSSAVSWLPDIVERMGLNPGGS